MLRSLLQRSLPQRSHLQHSLLQRSLPQHSLLQRSHLQHNLPQRNLPQRRLPLCALTIMQLLPAQPLKPVLCVVKRVALRWDIPGRTQHVLNLPLAPHARKHGEVPMAIRGGKQPALLQKHVKPVKQPKVRLCLTICMVRNALIATILIFRNTP